MGACTSKKHEKSDPSANPGVPSVPNKPTQAPESLPSHPSPYIPEFPYFERSEGIIRLIQSEDILSFPFKQFKSFALESAICILSTGQMLLIGGTIKGELVQDVDLLDIKLKSLRNCATLPMPCKQGQAHHVGDWVYYVGGLICGELRVLQQSPFMRYNLKDDYWENLIDVSEQYGFSKIFNMGTCELGGKLLIIGGQRVNSQKKMKNNKTLYSIDLKNNFRVKVEGKIPFKVSKPLVAAGKNWAVVAGGFISKNLNPNKLSCVIELNENDFKVNQVQDTGIQLLEKYPAFNDGKLALMVQFPNITLFNYEKKSWMAFRITDKKTRVFIDIKNQTSNINDAISSDDSHEIEKKIDMNILVSNEKENLGSVFRKKVDLEEFKKEKDLGIEKQNLKINASMKDEKVEVIKEKNLGPEEIQLKIDDSKNVEKFENFSESKHHDKIDNEKISIDSLKKSGSNKSSKSSNGSSGYFSSNSSQSSLSKSQYKQEYSQPGPIEDFSLTKHILAPQPTPPHLSEISNYPLTDLNPEKKSSNPILMTAIPEFDDIEEIQIKKSSKIPSLNLEQQLEDSNKSISINLKLDPEIIRVSTPKVKQSSALPGHELKLRPNTTNCKANPNSVLKSKLKPLTVKEFKPYITSKTFRGNLNYLRSPDKQETLRTFRSVYFSPDQRSMFIKNFEDIKTCRVNLFGTVPKSFESDTKVKILYSKLFPEENVQKLSDLVMTELARPCKLVPVIDSFLSLKEFFTENLKDTLITIDNLNHIFTGIPLILSKKAFTKNQISYISSKSQLTQSNSNLSLDTFSLAIYKAYKVALFKKT